MPEFAAVARLHGEFDVDDAVEVAHNGRHLRELDKDHQVLQDVPLLPMCDLAWLASSPSLSLTMRDRAIDAILHTATLGEVYSTHSVQRSTHSVDLIVPKFCCVGLAIARVVEENVSPSHLGLDDIESVWALLIVLARLVPLVLAVACLEVLAPAHACQYPIPC